MGGMSLWHWVIVALVILVLFGRGKKRGPSYRAGRH